MMKCKNCGQPLKDGTRFCTQCGTPIEIEQESPVPESAISLDLNPDIDLEDLASEGMNTLSDDLMQGTEEKKEEGDGADTFFKEAEEEPPSEELKPKKEKKFGFGKGEKEPKKKEEKEKKPSLLSRLKKGISEENKEEKLPSEEKLPTEEDRGELNILAIISTVVLVIGLFFFLYFCLLHPEIFSGFKGIGTYSLIITYALAALICVTAAVMGAQASRKKEYQRYSTVILVCGVLFAAAIIGLMSYKIYQGRELVNRIAQGVTGEQKDRILEDYEKLSKNVTIKYQMDRSLLVVTGDIPARYAEDELNYDEVSAQLDIISEIGTDSALVASVTQEVENLHFSKESYIYARNAQDEEKYEVAVIGYQQVISGDKNFDDAQRRLKECRTQYRNMIRSEVESQIVKGNYEKALAELDIAEILLVGEFTMQDLKSACEVTLALRAETEKSEEPEETEEPAAAETETEVFAAVPTETEVVETEVIETEVIETEAVETEEPLTEAALIRETENEPVTEKETGKETEPETLAAAVTVPETEETESEEDTEALTEKETLAEESETELQTETAMESELQTESETESETETETETETESETEKETEKTVSKKKTSKSSLKKDISGAQDIIKKKQ